jgi:O-antigen/teichoic acid export membrane protein
MNESSATPPHHQRQIARNITIMGLSLAITMLMALLLRVLMPRMLGPEKLGIFYFAESFSNLFFTFLPLGLNTYIFRKIPAHPDHAPEIVSSMLLVQVLMASLLGMGLWTALSLGSYDAVTRQTTLVMGLYAAIMIFSKSILHNVFLALEQVKLISFTNILVKFVLVVCCVLALWNSSSLLLLASMYLLSELTGLGLLAWIAHRKHLFAHPPSFLKIRSLLKISLPFYLAGVLNGVYAEINTTMLSHLADHKEVGYFGAAYKLIGVFLLFIPLMQSSLSPSLSQAYAEANGSFERLIQQVLRFFLIVCLPLSLGILLFGDIIATLLYGSAFAPSFKVLAYLSPLLIMMYLNTLMATCLNLVSSGHRLALIFFAAISLNIALNAVFIPLGLARGGEGYAAQYVSFSSFLCEAFAFTAMVKIFPTRIWSRELSLRCLAIFIPCCLGIALYPQIIGLTIPQRLFLAALIPVYAFGLRLVTWGECKGFWLLIRNRRQREEPTSPST